MKIGFFGTPRLAAQVLTHCIETGWEIMYVVSQEDKPVGRKSERVPSAVSLLAIQHWLPLLRPARVKNNQEFLDTIAKYDVDYIVVVAYGNILPESVLLLPRYLSINIHGSLLPHYRGASPVQSALLSGESQTGMTIMCMSVGMDEGDMLRTQTIKIDPNETSDTLFDKLSISAGPLLISVLEDFIRWKITPIQQDHSRATYTKKFSKSDGQVLPLVETAEQIYRKYQAFTSWPGIWALIGDRSYKFFDISVAGSFDLPAGSASPLSQGGMLLGTSQGDIIIGHITPAGGNKKRANLCFWAPGEVAIKQLFI